MELGLGHKERLILYLHLEKEDYDISDLLQRIIESDVLTKEEVNRLLLFIKERSNVVSVEAMFSKNEINTDKLLKE